MTFEELQQQHELVVGIAIGALSRDKSKYSEAIRIILTLESVKEIVRRRNGSLLAMYYKQMEIDYNERSDS